MHIYGIYAFPSCGMGFRTHLANAPTTKTPIPAAGGVGPYVLVRKSQGGKYIRCVYARCVVMRGDIEAHVAQCAGCSQHAPVSTYLPSGGPATLAQHAERSGRLCCPVLEVLISACACNGFGTQCHLLPQGQKRRSNPYQAGYQAPPYRTLAACTP